MLVMFWYSMLEHANCFQYHAILEITELNKFVYIYVEMHHQHKFQGYKYLRYKANKIFCELSSSPQWLHLLLLMKNI